MAADALDKSLWVVTTTRQSYMSVCGTCSGDDEHTPKWLDSCQTVPVNNGNTKTSPAQVSRNGGTLIFLRPSFRGFPVT